MLGIRTAPAVAALAAAVLALTACGDTAPPAAPKSTTAGPSAAAQPTPSGPAASTASTGEQTIPQTLSFSARTVDGDSFAGSTLVGKPAVLWFWAAWCSRCRAVAGEVAAVQQDNADRVNVIGVAGLGSGDEAMRRFAEQTGIDRFPNLADDDGQVFRRFEVTSQEQYVLLDSAGTVVHSGPLSQQDLRKRVTGLS
ncbi:redoxin domain-containing protein [Micromonospora sp. HNM0581]|uniref:redoxin domain-containing protein n=1 Tax=Micromonospora sp. HNM0581 TaxID=2716341 RepID=UPI00146C54E2|nr:redoxin domain-containing protein [Micromonospora sp. HNM0581]